MRAKQASDLKSSASTSTHFEGSELCHAITLENATERLEKCGFGLTVPTSHEFEKKPPCRTRGQGLREPDIARSKRTGLYTAKSVGGVTAFSDIEMQYKNAGSGPKHFKSILPLPMLLALHN